MDYSCCFGVRGSSDDDKLTNLSHWTGLLGKTNNTLVNEHLTHYSPVKCRLIIRVNLNEKVDRKLKCLKDGEIQLTHCLDMMFY